MVFLGGEKCIRCRPGTLFRWLLISFFVLSAHFSGLLSGEFSLSGDPALFSAELYLQIQAVYNYVPVLLRRSTLPPSIPGQTSLKTSAVAPRARFLAFTLLTSSAWLIVGHGQTASHGGSTSLICLLGARYGHSSSTFLNLSKLLCTRLGCMISNGNNGEVPESVPPLASSPSLLCLKSIPISYRICYHQLVEFIPELIISAHLSRVCLEESFGACSCLPVAPLLFNDISRSAALPEIHHRRRCGWSLTALHKLLSLGQTHLRRLGFGPQLEKWINVKIRLGLKSKLFPSQKSFWTLLFANSAFGSDNWVYEPLWNCIVSFF